MIILVVLCLFLGSSSALSSPERCIKIGIVPSQVQLQGVTHSYPDTLWRRLTSSVPRRPHALSDLTLTFHDSEFCLLTGASSSGKSTVFRLVQGHEKPSVSGSVEIIATSCQDSSIRTFETCTDGGAGVPTFVENDASSSLILEKSVWQSPSEVLRLQQQLWMATPRILDEKPTLLLKSNESPREHLIRSLSSKDSASSSSLSCRTNQVALVDILAFALGANDWIGDNQAQLSQSQLYVYKVMETALSSMLPSSCENSQNAAIHVDDSTTWFLYPAPILLLDEWLDKETSAVIRNVQSSLQRFVQMTGAVVVCATHVPDRFLLATSSSFSSSSSCPSRRVILQSGKLLLDSKSTGRPQRFVG